MFILHLVAAPAVTQAAGSSAMASNNNLMENVKKCKNFLSTLIKLASNQPADTVKNVKNLIQGLIVSILYNTKTKIAYYCVKTMLEA